ncbi:MAG: hypothetical protein ACLVAK_07985 [Clostridia bacterium]
MEKQLLNEISRKSRKSLKYIELLAKICEDNNEKNIVDLLYRELESVSNSVSNKNKQH